MPTSVNFMPTPTGTESRDSTCYPGLLGREGPRIHRVEGQSQPRLVPSCRNASLLVSLSSSGQHPRCASSLWGHSREGGLWGQPAEAHTQGRCPLPAWPTSLLERGPGTGPGGVSPEMLCCGPRSIPCSSMRVEALVQQEVDWVWPGRTKFNSERVQDRHLFSSRPGSGPTPSHLHKDSV